MVDLAESTMLAENHHDEDYRVCLEYGHTMVVPLGVRAFLASFRLSDCTMEIELQFVAPVCVHISIVHLVSPI